MRFLSALALSLLVLSSSALAASGDFTPSNDSSRRTNGLVYEVANPQIDPGGGNQDWVDVLLTGGAPAQDAGGIGTDVEFNLYRDDTFFAQLKRHIPLGLNREASINYVHANAVDATHMDERDFLAARHVKLDLTQDDDEKYEHSLTGIDTNDEIKVMLYVHNNATHVCDETAPVNPGTPTEATNTTVSLDWSDKPTTTTMNLVGNINADNEDMTAVTGINDTVDLGFASADLGFQVNGITVLKRIDPNGTPTGNECGSTNQGWETVDAIAGGHVTSTSTSAEVDLSAISDIDGSYANVHVIIFRLEAVPLTREFSISKSGSPDPLTNTVEPGDTITFTVEVENISNPPVAITNLEVTDNINTFFTFDSGPAGTNESSDPLFDAGSLPNLLLDFDTLAAGATETLSFDVTVTTGGGAPPSGTQVCNSATGTADTLGNFTSNDECYLIQVNPNCGNGILELDKNEECDDGNTTSEDGCSSTCTVEDSGLTITKTADVSNGQTIAQDSTLRYNLSFANTGQQELNNVVITDVIKTGLTFVDVEDSGGNSLIDLADFGGADPNPPGTATTAVDPAGTLLTINIPSLPALSSYDYYIDTTVDTNAEESIILNTADIEGEAVDPYTGTVTLNRTSIQTNHNIPAKCGNGIIEDGLTAGGVAESCDDGNLVNGDGCDNTCSLEVLDITLLKYGDDPLSGATVGRGDTIEYRIDVTNNGPSSMDSVVITDVLDSRLTYLLPIGDLEIDHVGGTVTITVDGGLAAAETKTYNFTVQVGAAAATGELTNVLTVDASGPNPDQVDIDDGPSNQTKHFVVESVTPVCGNGRLESGSPREECDDGNTTALDGCSDLCVLEDPNECGINGIGPGEQCDDGNRIPGDGCNDFCQNESACGNGVLEAGEQGDDGNFINGDGINDQCQIEVDGVTLEKKGIPYSGSTIGAGQEITYTFEFENPEIVDILNVEITDVLNSNLEFVSSSDCTYDGPSHTVTCDVGTLPDVTEAPNNQGTVSFVAQVIADPTFGAVTNTANLAGTPEGQSDPISVDSNGTIYFVVEDIVKECGNGRLEARIHPLSPDEQCDDGNTTSGDGCDNLCQFEGLQCANGTTDGVGNEGEECDDNNLIPGDNCNELCQNEFDCGNGVIEIGEQCDDGNRVATDNCDNTCTERCSTGFRWCEASSQCVLAGDPCVGDCNNDGTCDATESCDCPDCSEKEDKCVIGAVCLHDTVDTAQSACVDGCQEGYRWCESQLRCVIAGDLCDGDCNSDGTCDEGESCDCPDCHLEQDQCRDGLLCVHYPDNPRTSQCFGGCGEGYRWCEDQLECVLAGDSCVGDCNENGTCEAGESCDCPDCADEFDFCRDGLTCTYEASTPLNSACRSACPDGTAWCPILQECIPEGAGCSREGGGAAPVRSVVGICNMSPSLSPQCIGKRPERSNEYWDFYTDCSDKPEFSEEECALQWAVHEGFQLCGDLAREFYRATPAEAMANCGYEPPKPLRLSCTPSFCADCIFGTADMGLGVLDPHEGSPVYKAEGVYIASKEKVEYRATVDLGLKDADNFQIREDIPVRVNIYDYTIPAESAHVWYREGIINEDTCEESQYGRECWVVRDATAGGKIFTRALTKEEIQLINAGATQTVVFEYDMKSDFLFEETYAESLSNVVFATLEFGYDYYDESLEVWSAETNAVYGIGGDVCSQPVYFADLFSEESTLGARSTITLQRPTLQVHGGEARGSQMLQTSLFGQAAGDTVTPGWTAEGDTIANYYRNLIQNSINISGGVLFDQMIPETDTSIYHINSGDVKLIGSLNMHGTSKTFIIDNYNLEILDDFEIVNGFAAFIVLGGDVVISNHVQNMEGIFIAKGTERNRQMVGGNIRPELGVGKSSVPLQVSGSLIGNLEQLTANRVYIGSYGPGGEFTTQPSIESLFDVRMLEQTPPGMEATRGTDWGQSN